MSEKSAETTQNDPSVLSDDDLSWLNGVFEQEQQASQRLRIIHERLQQARQRAVEARAVREHVHKRLRDWYDCDEDEVIMLDDGAIVAEDEARRRASQKKS